MDNRRRLKFASPMPKQPAFPRPGITKAAFAAQSPLLRAALTIGSYRRIPYCRDALLKTFAQFRRYLVHPVPDSFVVAIRSRKRGANCLRPAAVP